MRAHHDFEHAYATLLDRRFQATLFQDLVGLEPLGPGYRAVCPFHTESLPTMLIAGDRPAWFCFACSAKGDWLSYLMRREGLEYGAALSRLAAQAGMRIDLSEEGWRADVRRAEILESAAAFFQAELWSHRHEPYLARRGYTQTELETMGIGRFPGYRATVENLRATCAEADIAEVFTTRAEEAAIVIPYRDAAGRLMGLYGRRPEEIPGAEAYRPLTTMERLQDTPLLIHKARGGPDMVVVEGFLDALLADAIGIRGVIGVGHAGLTPGLLDTLVRYGARRIVLALNTPAATTAALALIRACGLEAAVVQRPEEFADTDAYIRGTCIHKFGQLVEKAVPAEEWNTGS